MNGHLRHGGRRPAEDLAWPGSSAMATKTAKPVKLVDGKARILARKNAPDWGRLHGERAGGENGWQRG